MPFTNFTSSTVNEIRFHMSGFSDFIISEAFTMTGNSSQTVYTDGKLKFSWSTGRFTVVNSKARLRSDPQDPWVLKTKAILDQFDPKKNLLITGIGMLHYDFPLFYWLKRAGNAVVIAEGNPGEKRLNGHYQWFINHRSIQWILLNSPELQKSSTKHTKQLRDLMVMALSETVVKGTVTANGNMAQLCRLYCKEGGKITEIVATDYPQKRHRMVPEKKVLQKPDSIPVAYPKDYLWHYVRGRHCPWQGLGWETYLAGLSGQGQPVPYSALDTLMRILDQKQIMASSYLIRGGYPVVCCSEHSPDQMRSLFHWQKHLRRRRFEPYAIGIRKELAQQLGFRTVVYGSISDYENLDGEERYRFQNLGKSTQDWPSEKEWRKPGSVSLVNLDFESMAIAVPNGDDAIRIQAITAIPVYSEAE